MMMLNGIELTKEYNRKETELSSLCRIYVCAHFVSTTDVNQIQKIQLSVFLSVRSEFMLICFIDVLTRLLLLLMLTVSVQIVCQTSVLPKE
jgi:hypothetical protein